MLYFLTIAFILAATVSSQSLADIPPCAVRNIFTVLRNSDLMIDRALLLWEASKQQPARMYRTFNASAAMNHSSLASCLR